MRDKRYEVHTRSPQHGQQVLHICRHPSRPLTSQLLSQKRCYNRTCIRITQVGARDKGSVRAILTVLLVCLANWWQLLQNGITKRWQNLLEPLDFFLARSLLRYWTTISPLSRLEDTNQGGRDVLVGGLALLGLGHVYNLFTKQTAWWAEKGHLVIGGGWEEHFVIIPCLNTLNFREKIS